MSKDKLETAVVRDSMPYAQEKGQPLNVQISWSKHHTGSFNLSLFHAVQLRNALNTKLEEADRAALARIDAHLEALGATK